MRNKTHTFADLGERRQSTTETDFRTGMIRNTIAMAEDVNTYGNMIDEQVEIITKEIVNALEGQGITIDPNLDNQVLTMIQSKLPAGYSLTGVYYDGVTKPTATQNGVVSITFSAFTAYFNTKGYFGNKQTDITKVEVAQTTVAVDNSWAAGVHFLYLTTAGAISHSQNPISATNMDSMCMLGSVFVIDNSGTKEFQSGSFKYQPWLVSSDHRSREVPVAETKGGYISAASSTELQMGALEVVDEGINFLTDERNPSIMSLQGGLFMHKVLHPDYDPSLPETSTIDTSHIYNMTTGQYEQVNSSAIGRFMVLVPCIVPTGQTLLIAAMTEEVDGHYTQVFQTQQEAELAVFGLKYTDPATDKTRERCIYIGQSLIVKIGTNIDLTDNDNFKSVGVVPQELAGFTSSAGQAGGAAGQFIPMPQYDFSGETAFAITNNAANVAGGANGAITATLPTPKQTIINQFEIYYSHTATDTGITFTGANVSWWYNRQPVFTTGHTYLIIGEYIWGKWRLGYMEANS